MRAGKELCNDPALALHFGEAFDMAELSIVGLLGHACQTIAEAFAQLNRYERLIADVDGVAAGNRLVLSRRADQLWLIDTRGIPMTFLNSLNQVLPAWFARRVGCPARSSW